MTLRRAAALLGLIAVLAFALELWFLVAGQRGLSSGLHPGYDESVYVGASWLLRRGQLPYRDFVYVFPPGFLVLLWPITTLAGLFGGPALGLTLARVVAALVAALNVYLVGRIGMRWLGVAGGVVAALILATTPAVLDAEASVLQEPFVVLAVLLAFGWVSDRPSLGGRRVVWVALLLGVAASIKLVAGFFVIPVLIGVAFTRPVVDRLRLMVWSIIPLAVSTAVVSVVVGWREPFEQIFAAQLLRPRGGEGLSRVDSMLALFRGQTVLSGSIAETSPWVAVGLFVAVCAAATARPGSSRLWGTTGLVGVVVLLASPSYYSHYAVLLAPAVALLLVWTATVGFRIVTDYTSPRAVAAGVLCVGILVAGLQLEAGLAGSTRDQVVSLTPRMTKALVSAECVFSIRPQLLFEVDRLPPSGPHGRVLLDIYGSALVAARHQPVVRGDFSAADAPAVQAEVRRQSRACDHTLLTERRCPTGRRDLTAATYRYVLAHGKVVAYKGCVQLVRRQRGRATRR